MDATRVSRIVMADSPANRVRVRRKIRYIALKFCRFRAGTDEEGDNISDRAQLS
jgi:hypothetical protein